MSRSSRGAVAVKVLTCSDSPEMRLASARRQLSFISERHSVEVVRGFVPGDAGLEGLYDRVRNRRAMNRRLSDREIAVYGTHRLAWKSIRNGPAPVGVVVEDDFAITDRRRFAEIVDEAARICSGRGVVKLFDFPKTGANPVVATFAAGSVQLVRWRYPTAGLVAYMITRDTAAKLLARERVFRPVDEDLKYFWEMDLDVWSVSPSPVGEQSDTLGGSLIDHDRRAAKSRVISDRLRGNLIRLHWKLNCRLRNAGRDLTKRRGTSS